MEFTTHVGVKASTASQDPFDNDLRGGGGHFSLSKGQLDSEWIYEVILFEGSGILNLTDL